ncbi:hypothetical protein [Nocardia sp. NBC_00511]|uniref:hypothetical protein n=1 Tax=Nocardia sp. NBC_00511 TaxID=2903591 RepID=UPI0030E3177E
MNRTVTRRAASVAAIAAIAALGATTAAADQPQTPAESGAAQLSSAATDDGAKAAVAATVKTAQLITAAKMENVQFAPFSYGAPTLGCGYNMPFSLTSAIAVTGVNSPNGAIAQQAAGNVTFQVLAQQNGFPTASGLSVAWLNVNNGRSGITPLDDQTDYNLPALTRTVDAGPGNVVASLWGTIDYPAARCVVLPTVGLFSIPDAPAPQAVPATPDTTQPGATTTAPAAPTTTAPVAPTTPAAAPDAGSGNATPAEPTTAAAPDGGSGAASTPAN